MSDWLEEFRRKRAEIESAPDWIARRRKFFEGYAALVRENRFYVTSNGNGHWIDDCDEDYTPEVVIEELE
jgi:hypothetical protein